MHYDNMVVGMIQIYERVDNTAVVYWSTKVSVFISFSNGKKCVYEVKQMHKRYVYAKVF